MQLGVSGRTGVIALLLVLMELALETCLACLDIMEAIWCVLGFNQLIQHIVWLSIQCVNSVVAALTMMGEVQRMSADFSTILLHLPIFVVLDLTKVMIVGGEYGGSNNDCEIVDLDGGTCSAPTNYPQDGFGSTGDMVDCIPVVCGGSPTGGPCRQYDFTTATWVNPTTAQVPLFAKSILFNSSTLWVTGGEPLNANTWFYQNGQLTPGGNLPYATKFHCLAKINGTHILMTGGVNGFNFELRHAHLLDTVSGVWTVLPQMLVPRGGHSCGLAGGTRIAVWGGFTTPTAEMFDLATWSWVIQTWFYGPIMASAIVMHEDTFLTFGGTFVQLGMITGRTDKVLQYDEATDTLIERTADAMITSRLGSAAFKILDSMC